MVVCKQEGLLLLVYNNKKAMFCPGYRLDLKKQIDFLRRRGDRCFSLYVPKIRRKLTPDRFSGHECRKRGTRGGRDNAVICARHSIVRNGENLSPVWRCLGIWLHWHDYYEHPHGNCTLLLDI